MENQVVFVTSGAMGMGEAVAVLAAERGAKVVVADINVADAQKTVEKIKSFGGDASAVKCDVSSAIDVEAAINFVVEKYGRRMRSSTTLESNFNLPNLQIRPKKSTTG